MGGYGNAEGQQSNEARASDAELTDEDGSDVETEENDEDGRRTSHHSSLSRREVQSTVSSFRRRPS